jgi:hypothetical protein
VPLYTYQPPIETRLLVRLELAVALRWLTVLPRVVRRQTSVKGEAFIHSTVRFARRHVFLNTLLLHLSMWVLKSLWVEIRCHVRHQHTDLAQTKSIMKRWK